VISFTNAVRFVLADNAKREYAMSTHVNPTRLVPS
jgi:hypothetical protein